MAFTKLQTPFSINLCAHASYFLRANIAFLKWVQRPGKSHVIKLRIFLTFDHNMASVNINIKVTHEET